MASGMVSAGAEAEETPNTVAYLNPKAAGPLSLPKPDLAAEDIPSAAAIQKLRKSAVSGHPFRCCTPASRAPSALQLYDRDRGPGATSTIRN
jgi:hypothetical protein